MPSKTIKEFMQEASKRRSAPEQPDPTELAERLRALKAVEDDTSSAKAEKRRSKGSGSNSQAENSRPKGSSFDKPKDSMQQHNRRGSRPAQLMLQDKDQNVERGPDSSHSQVIVSGDCTPGSEGVKRSERKDVKHWGSG